MSIVRKVGLVITEAGLAGAPLLPLFIFVTTIFNAHGQIQDVLPFVLFYSFLKTGSYAIQAFGTVNNPFRLAQISALVYAVGSLITIFGPMSRWCFDIGAILIGAGLSVFVPMYKTVKDILRAKKQFPYHMETPGYLLMLILVVAIMFTYAYAEQIILIVYCLMAIISILTIHTIVQNRAEMSRPLFVDNGRHWYYLISSFLLLALVFFIRLFKQTANLESLLLICLLSTVIISLNVIPEFIHGKRVKIVQFHEFFYGEAIVLIILYSVFYFTSIGQERGVFITFAVIFVGMMVAQVIGRKLVFAHPDLQISNFLIMAIMLCTFFLFSPMLYFPALFVLGLLICLGFMRMTYLYKNWSSYSVYEQRLSSQFAKNLGTIIGQWILLITMTIVSYAYFHNGRQTLLSYVDHVTLPDAQQVFLITKVVCIAVLWIQVIFFAIREIHAGTVFYHKTTPQVHTPDPDIVNVLQ